MFLPVQGCLQPAGCLRWSSAGAGAGAAGAAAAAAGATGATGATGAGATGAGATGAGALWIREEEIRNQIEEKVSRQEHRLGCKVDVCLIFSSEWLRLTRPATHMKYISSLQLVCQSCTVSHFPSDRNTFKIKDPSPGSARPSGSSPLHENTFQPVLVFLKFSE